MKNTNKKIKLVILILVITIFGGVMYFNIANYKYIKTLKTTPEGAVKAHLLEENDINRKDKKTDRIISCDIEAIDGQKGYYKVENPPRYNSTGIEARYFTVTKNGQIYFVEGTADFPYWEAVKEFKNN